MLMHGLILDMFDQTRQENRHMHNLPIRRTALLAMLVLWCSACTPMATYPTEGKGEALLPWMYPVPQVMAKSLAETYRKTVPNGSEADHPLVYNLPEGISKRVWQQVAIDTRIEGARAATPADLSNGTMIWSVERVAVRGLKAKVDVVYQSGNVHQLAIVSLTSPPLGLFSVSSFQRLLITADAPVIHNPVAESEKEMMATDDDLMQPNGSAAAAAAAGESND